MISFNGNNLESAYLIVNKLNKANAPTREIQSETLSFQDGFNVVADFWRSRTIAISGTITATTANDLATQIDLLKMNLSGVNKNLDVDYGASTRRYVGTLTKLEAPEEFYNITHLPYTAEFLCQPFGYATSNQVLSGNGVTGSVYTNTLTVIGTYKPQPIFSLAFNTENAASAVSFSNSTTGDTITITHNFQADDVLYINTETHKVTLNGVQVDFTGPMPDFVVGENNISISVPATARNYDFSIIYTPTYL